MYMDKIFNIIIFFIGFTNTIFPRETSLHRAIKSEKWKKARNILSTKFLETTLNGKNIYKFMLLNYYRKNWTQTNNKNPEVTAMQKYEAYLAQLEEIREKLRISSKRLYQYLDTAESMVTLIDLISNNNRIESSLKISILTSIANVKEFKNAHHALLKNFIFNEYERATSNFVEWQHLKEAYFVNRIRNHNDRTFEHIRTSAYFTEMILENIYYSLKFYTIFNYLGNNELVAYLNQKDSDHKNVIHTCVEKNENTLLLLLLLVDANCNVADNNQKIPFIYALENYSTSKEEAKDVALAQERTIYVLAEFTKFDDDAYNKRLCTLINQHRFKENILTLLTAVAEQLPISAP